MEAVKSSKSDARGAWEEDVLELMLPLKMGLLCFVGNGGEDRSDRGDVASGVSSDLGGGGRLQDMIFLPAGDGTGDRDFKAPGSSGGGIEQAITCLSGVAAFTIARLAGWKGL